MYYQYLASDDSPCPWHATASLTVPTRSRPLSFTTVCKTRLHVISQLEYTRRRRANSYMPICSPRCQKLVIGILAALSKTCSWHVLGSIRVGPSLPQNERINTRQQMRRLSFPLFEVENRRSRVCPQPVLGSRRSQSQAHQSFAKSVCRSSATTFSRNISGHKDGESSDFPTAVDLGRRKTSKKYPATRPSPSSKRSTIAVHSGERRWS